MNNKNTFRKLFEPNICVDTNVYAFNRATIEPLGLCAHEYIFRLRMLARACVTVRSICACAYVCVCMCVPVLLMVVRIRVMCEQHLYIRHAYLCASIVEVDCVTND